MGWRIITRYARNCFFPILVKKNKIIGFGEVSSEDFHPKKQTEEIKGTYYVWPIDINGIERNGGTQDRV